MTITSYVICIRNIWRYGITLNYINILQPVYFNVFLHGNLLRCTYTTLEIIFLSALYGLMIINELLVYTKGLSFLLDKVIFPLSLHFVYD